MGLDRTIRFATSETPSWEAILAELAPICDSVAIRMIDGLPAFPNEIPEPGWKELRIALAGGMVSIRRGSGSIACVIWGTGDPLLQTAWAKVVWACARAGGGRIESAGGTQTSAEFAIANGLTES
jgi:hypothetical protein